MGAVRAALQAHAAQLEAGTPGLTWRDLARALELLGLINTAAPGEMLLVRRTVENMVRTGALPVVGEAKRAWSRRPVKLYGAFRPACDFGVADVVPQADAVLNVVVRAG
jgi:hypothetical protein